MKEGREEGSRGQNSEGRKEGREWKESRRKRGRNLLILKNEVKEGSQRRKDRRTEGRKEGEGRNEGRGRKEGGNNVKEGRKE